MTAFVTKCGSRLGGRKLLGDGKAVVNRQQKNAFGAITHVHRKTSPGRI
jgi:hypothetical protein